MNAGSPRHRGFTLVELMVTVAIAGILATMAFPVREMVAKRENERQLRLALREIRVALDAYKKASDEGRTQSAADATGYPPNLDILVEGINDVTSAEKRKVYFLRRIPRDPFNDDPAVAAPETWGKRSYASSHDEPREGRDVYDVYSKSQSKGLNGVPYREW